jgi:hypothetical protein
MWPERRNAGAVSFWGAAGDLRGRVAEGGADAVGDDFGGGSGFAGGLVGPVAELEVAVDDDGVAFDEAGADVLGSVAEDGGAVVLGVLEPAGRDLPGGDVSGG